MIKSWGFVRNYRRILKSYLQSRSDREKIREVRNGLVGEIESTQLECVEYRDDNLELFFFVN